MVQIMGGDPYAQTLLEHLRLSGHVEESASSRRQGRVSCFLFEKDNTNLSKKSYFYCIRIVISSTAVDFRMS